MVPLAGQCRLASWDRSGSASFTPTTVPTGLEDLSDYGFDLTGENDFEGGGGSQAENTFTGTITVRQDPMLPPPFKIPN